LTNLPLSLIEKKIMKKHLLLTIALLITAISGANAASLQPSVTIPASIAPGDSTPTSPTDPNSPTFNPSGIQSILSSNGNLSTVFSGIVTAFPGLDPNIASALTTASKYAPIAQSVLAGQQPTPAQIGQIASGMNGGSAIGINFGAWGLDSEGKIQPLNPDGSVKTDDPTGKMIAYQASNLLNGKGLDTKAVIAQIDLGKQKSGSSVAEANRQNTNKAVSSIMGATGDANNSTLATGAAQADLSAKAGSSFNRMGAMNNMLSQSLIMGATANTIGLANLSQGENLAKHNALVQQRNLAQDEEKRVEVTMDSLSNTYLEANKIKARARLCASSNICWI
jgi:hypothetical protein